MKFAVFKYDYTPNLGDEIQSVAAARLLPRVDSYVEREEMHRFSADEPVFLIANGWYLHNSAAFPPSPSVRPFYVSVHFTSEHLLHPAAVDHLKEHEPVGCRDPFTLSVMHRYGVKAYLSGCLTMTLEPSEASNRTNAVYLVDVSESLLHKIPEELLRSAVRQTHVPTGRGREEKFAEAKRLLELYATARLVITGRLHCALPCLALKTPVIFLHPDRNERRFGAITPFLSVHDSEVNDIDWQPKPPEITEHARHLRALCEYAIEAGSNPSRQKSISETLVSQLQVPWTRKEDRS